METWRQPRIRQQNRQEGKETARAQKPNSVARISQFVTSSATPQTLSPGGTDLRLFIAVESICQPRSRATGESNTMMNKRGTQRFRQLPTKVPAVTLLLLLLISSLQLHQTHAVYAPNHFLGTCLTQDWVASMEAQLGVLATERDKLHRLVYPFLHAALSHPRYQVIDWRTARAGIYTPECMGDGPMIYGAGAQLDADGKITNQGKINGTLIVEVGAWASNEMTTNVFSILASEVYGYEVSLLYITESVDLTQRMSSVGTGLCTPVHASLEVWTTGIEKMLQRFSNESFAVGGVGYFGHSGLYTTVDFIQSAALNTTKYPAGPYFANFWKSYQVDEPIIQAVPVSTFTKNAAFYPPAEPGCDDNTYGCLNQCSKSAACTERESQPGGKECLVVVMMYGYYDPGYLQAAMSNIGIPAYFCFIGYNATAQYALYAQKNNIPVLFYHYEPDPFHIQHAGLFDRVFLPRSIPERVVLATSEFGENGYGKATNNPVDVDFPSTTLTKYAASLLYDDLNGDSPVSSLLDKMTIKELYMNDMLRKLSTFPKDPEQPAPEFQAACAWLRENYNVWKLWLDRLPLCTFDDHIQYEISGCDTLGPKGGSSSIQQTSTYRTITFSWKHPDPSNASLPYTCDGGLIEYPPPLKTSRSCEWIIVGSSRWMSWIETKPICDASFYNYSVSDCDSNSKRTVHYYWLLSDPNDPTKSLECDATTVSLPDDVLVDCEFVPFSSPLFQIVVAVDGVLIALLGCAMIFVYMYRKAPIIKRSQFELLELMIVGGIIVCFSALAYAGEPSDLLCGARPLLVSSGFTTIFGALFVKSLRVYRVFMKSSMKRMTITTLMMIKVLSVFYVVDIAIIGVWFSADFPRPMWTQEVAKEFRGTVDRIACHSESFIFSVLLMFWKAIVLFLGIYTSFLIRNVSADFQESIWIFSSSVMVLVGCLVILPLAYLVDMPAVPFYGFLAGSLLLCTTVVMSFMLVPKVFRLHAESTSSSSSKYSTAASSRIVQLAKGLSVRGPGSNEDSSDQSSATVASVGGANKSKYPLGVGSTGRQTSATGAVLRPRQATVQPVPESTEIK